ncbi:RING-H2 finger protein ATL16-like [Phoenix dactylifera]|uniref:RING-type E3 ubiquitin transferase n=1 Tax=Phoenix dactylifera TaxID=42345 RepID=A0A8B7BKY7_PHODC|nr:RING-H2 finger protein ATL16-like [Phoenix dactylifera]
MDPPPHDRPQTPQFLPPPPTLSNSSFPVLVTAICGILAAAILLLAYYLFVIKCFYNSRRSDVISRRSRSWMRSENSLMVFPTTIQSRGLEESAIRAIPTFRYRRAGDGDEQGKSSFHECAVCLNEFQDEEKIRVLPNCFHVFHIDCIDTWLQTNANCPLCRSDITTTSPIPDDRLMDFASHQNLQHSGDIVIEISNDGSDEVQAASSCTNTDPSSMKAEQGLGHKKGRKLYHTSSMGDECVDAREKDEQFPIQPIRRSFSMDASSDRQLYMAVQNILQQNPHFKEVSTEESSSSSSNSGRIRRSFFSCGPCRISRSAVLPIRNEG